MPGSTTTPGGFTSNSRSRSASAASTSAFRRTLPRLSTARSWLPERLPREVRGTSSANGSMNAPTWTVPSSTDDPAGSSRETAWSPNGIGPAGTLALRGGRKTIRPVSSTPGNSEIVGGTTAAQPAESPRIPSVNSSTTAPVLRSRNSRVASEPGSTATTGAVSVTDAPTRRSVTAAGAAEHADL